MRNDMDERTQLLDLIREALVLMPLGTKKRAEWVRKASLVAFNRLDFRPKKGILRHSADLAS